MALAKGDNVYQMMGYIIVGVLAYLAGVFSILLAIGMGMYLEERNRIEQDGAR